MNNTSRSHSAGCLLPAAFIVAIGLLMPSQQAFSQGQMPATPGPPSPPPAGRISNGVMPGEPAILPVLTDLDQAELPNRFGEATIFRINESGDFLFTSGRSSGLFLRRAGKPIARVVQRGDPAPGFPESLVDTLSNAFINNAGLVVFDADFALAEGSTTQHAIWAYDSAGYRLIAHTRADAPGTDGAQYGRSMSCCGFNHTGDIAFTASLTPLAGPARTTLFIAPAGLAPVRIAGPGDSAPGGGTLSEIQSLRLGASGEVLFQAAIVGGSGGYGLFVGSVSRGIRKIVAHGDARPDGGTFVLASPPQAGLINMAGDVAFGLAGDAGSIWTKSAAGGPVPVVVGQVTPVPPNPPLTGTIGTPVLQAFNDVGEVVFTGTAPSLQGWPNRSILMRSEPVGSAHGLHLVAAQDFTIDGSDGLVFGWEFRAFSLNSDGVLTFSNTNFMPFWRRLYQHDAGEPAFHVRGLTRDGDPAPLAGGGTFNLANTTATFTRSDGSVMFVSDVIGGSAFSGAFLVSHDGAQPLMSTEDPLPAGALPSWRPFRLGASNDFVLFCAEKAGGQSSLWLHDLAQATTVRVAGDGDEAPGVESRMRIGASSPLLNRRGGLAFPARLIGGAGAGRYGIFFRDADGILQKIVAAGDTFYGETIDGINFNTTPPKSLNDDGLMVFTASLVNPSTYDWVQALLVGRPGNAPFLLARGGDSAGDGWTFAGFSGYPSINASMVAFHAWVRDAGGRRVPGLFIISAGHGLVTIVRGGDAWISGGAFPATIPARFAFNDRGEVAFMTPLVGGPGGGVFVGTPSGLSAVALNGQAAPSGGSFVFNTQTPELDINDAGDVAFHASLAGGSADSGAFVRRVSDGVVRTIFLQGQPAPGTLGTIASYTTSMNGWPGENLRLGPTGEVLASTTFQVGADHNFGFWRFGADNMLTPLFMRGSLAPRGGGGTIAGAPQGAAVNDAGQFFFSLGVFGGRFAEAIYVTR